MPASQPRCSVSNEVYLFIESRRLSDISIPLDNQQPTEQAGPGWTMDPHPHPARSHPLHQKKFSKTRKTSGAIDTSYATFRIQ